MERLTKLRLQRCVVVPRHCRRFCSALWFLSRRETVRSGPTAMKGCVCLRAKLCISTCAWMTAVSGPSDRDPCEWWIIVTVHWGEGAGWLPWTSDLWPPVSELRHPQTKARGDRGPGRRRRKKTEEAGNGLGSSLAYLIQLWSHITVSISDTNAALMSPLIMPA